MYHLISVLLRLVLVDWKCFRSMFFEDTLSFSVRGVFLIPSPTCLCSLLPDSSSSPPFLEFEQCNHLLAEPCPSGSFILHFLSGYPSSPVSALTLKPVELPTVYQLKQNITSQCSVLSAPGSPVSSQNSKSLPVKPDTKLCVGGGGQDWHYLATYCKLRTLGPGLPECVC